jgi:MYXO-CTERM domain-containing protein
MKFRVTFAALVAALALPAAAWAHVTVHPNALPSGGFTVIDVNVPNELGGPATTKVDVQFPSGFIFLSTKPVSGWKSTVKYRKLAKPVTVYGEQHTTEVDRVIWTSSRGIKKGEFEQFPLSVAVPAAKAGSLLTFKAIQTYSDGKVVRWIGSPSASEPAPQVLVKSATAPVQDFPGGVSAARKTSSAHIAGAALVGLLGAAGLALYRRRHQLRS